ncbi:MAG: glucose-6-phosphate isomerase, partial [Rhizorhabdus sp.]
MTAAKDAWIAITGTAESPLSELFTTEPDRLSRLSIDESGILFDFSKTHLSATLVGHFQGLADGIGFAAKRDALFAGEIVNVTEGCAAEHPAERGQGAPDSVARARGFQSRMRA